MLKLELHYLTIAFGNLSLISEALGQADNLGKGFDFTSARHSKASAEYIAGVAKSARLPVTEAASIRLKELLVEAGDSANAGSYYIRAVKDACNALSDAFQKECASRQSVILRVEATNLYTQVEPLFGESVSLKFAKVATDISEAGKCLALERPTASVFHLMRVVEFAVKRLGKKLNVQIDVEKENWYQIIVHVNKAVDLLPTKSDRQRKAKQAIGAAAAHLNSVRIATRNDVMHPKATYTDEEATELFNATKQLMQQMAKIV